MSSKRLIAAFALLALVVAFAGCGSKSPGDQTTIVQGMHTASATTNQSTFGTAAATPSSP